MRGIAIVDDIADNRLLLRAMLEDLYSVAEYVTGVAALAGIRESPPDLVLLDAALPGLGGAEVVALIRGDERLRGIPVIAMTAHGMPDDRERFLALGFNEYIAKPIVDEQAFRDTVASFLPTEEPPR
jgi:CheY-like chemotaxis protein